MTWLDIVWNTIFLAVGGLIGFITTKWSMSRQKKDDLIGASKEIIGTADHILKTSDLVKQNDQKLSEILKLIAESRVLDGGSTKQESLSWELVINNLNK